ncbi:hypothetical protein KB219_20160, partial [Pseudomonas aeruginosa]|nr:hypothetical protein [Pseudomonas aeruginosa]
MLRVRETATAELLTNQLPKVQIYTSTPASGANDAINNKKAAFPTPASAARAGSSGCCWPPAPNESEGERHVR